LQRVLWVGGPPDAGKTTVADLLGRTHDLPVYHFDQQSMAHLARANRTWHPTLYALQRVRAEKGEAAWFEHVWVHQTPEEMARRAIASWTERVELAVGDLLAMLGDRPVIAEGSGFFPEAILPLLADRRAAIWLVPTDAFKKASHAQRDRSAFRRGLSDPGRALRNHVERDLLLAKHYRHSLQNLGLPVIEVDGSISATDIAANVEAHFGSLLLR